MITISRNNRYPLVNVYITNWKDPPCFMGKLTISMAIFNSYVTNYQRVILCDDLQYMLIVVKKWSLVVTSGYYR